GGGDSERGGSGRRALVRGGAGARGPRRPRVHHHPGGRVVLHRGCGAGGGGHGAVAPLAAGARAARVAPRDGDAGARGRGRRAHRRLGGVAPRRRRGRPLRAGRRDRARGVGRGLRAGVHRAPGRRRRAAPLRLARHRRPDRGAGHRLLHAPRPRRRRPARARGPLDLWRLLRGEPRRLRPTHRGARGRPAPGRPASAHRRARARGRRARGERERRVHAVRQRPLLLAPGRRPGPPARGPRRAAL
ncbi:MAG: FIG00003370: Multicopper polyphenol oxidase, partial [uncultured Gemmatimonadaceae bacterium]